MQEVFVYYVKQADKRGVVVPHPAIDEKQALRKCQVDHFIRNNELHSLIACSDNILNLK